MSLITRCPACGTMFKVVPDQLRISEGWVRCGHCAEVFDATGNMVEPADALDAPASQSDAQLTNPADFVITHGASIDSEVTSSIPGEGAESISSEVPDSVAAEAAAREPLEDEVQRVELRAMPEDRPFEFRREDIGGPQAAAAAVLPQAEAAPAVASEPQSEPEPELHDLTFVKQARRKAFWSARGTRVLLVLSAALLLLLLVGQVVYQERDRVAVLNPEWRPALVRMCGVLRCTLQPPRSIESIAIDNSSFNRLRGDTYRLNVALRNQATFQVAVPALELTLTDSGDQPVVRRVLVTSDFPAAPATIAARGEWSATLALSVNANGLANRISGYRVLAFYP